MDPLQKVFFVIGLPILAMGVVHVIVLIKTGPPPSPLRQMLDRIDAKYRD
jgi:hypothetical protein